MEAIERRSYLVKELESHVELDLYPVIAVEAIVGKVPCLSTESICTVTAE